MITPETPIDFLLERFRKTDARVAFVFEGQEFTYAWFADRIEYWRDLAQSKDIETGSVVSIVGDYSPEICALLWALIGLNTVIVPFASYQGGEKVTLEEIAEIQFEFVFEDGQFTNFRCIDRRVGNSLIQSVIENSRPGLIVFSSGSTGKPKGILHDFSKILEKFKMPRKTLKTLTFLQMDHLGGINTLFYVLSNCGTVVSAPDRSVGVICRMIQEQRVELLPVTPSFLNLLIASGEHEKWDLSSLKIITYGTEMMPEATLEAVKSLFPEVQLQQTYGLSELGVLRTKSREDGSLFLKVGGEGFQTRISGGTLWIKADSAMIGYLNAPQPFDEDGWFDTGDQVEVDGDFIRFLGRKSDIINVGGQKVFPSEVEDVLMQMENVRDVIVRSEKNFLVGNIVVARFSLFENEPADALRKRVRMYCSGKLSPYKIPQKVEISQGELHSARFKRVRN